MLGVEYLKMQVFFFPPSVALFYVTDAILKTTPFGMTLELPDMWLRVDIFTLSFTKTISLWPWASLWGCGARSDPIEMSKKKTIVRVPHFKKTRRHRRKRGGMQTAFELTHCGAARETSLWLDTNSNPIKEAENKAFVSGLSDDNH